MRREGKSTTDLLESQIRRFLLAGRRWVTVIGVCEEATNTVISTSWLIVNPSAGQMSPIDVVIELERASTSRGAGECPMTTGV